MRLASSDLERCRLTLARVAADWSDADRAEKRFHQQRDDFMRADAAALACKLDGQMLLAVNCYLRILALS